MIRLARASVARPKLALTLSAVIALALSLIGLGVSSSLSPSITVVPGSLQDHARAGHAATDDVIDRER